MILCLFAEYTVKHVKCVTENLCRQYNSYKTVKLHALLIKYECFMLLTYDIRFLEMRYVNLLFYATS